MVQFVNRIINECKGWPDPLQQLVTLDRWRDASGAARQEPDTKLALQLGNRMANG